MFPQPSGRRLWTELPLGAGSSCANSTGLQAPVEKSVRFCYGSGSRLGSTARARARLRLGLGRRFVRRRFVRRLGRLGGLGLALDLFLRPPPRPPRRAPGSLPRPARARPPTGPAPRPRPPPRRPRSPRAPPRAAARRLRGRREPHVDGHVREELDRHLVAADPLDRLRQLDLAPVDAHAPLGPELVRDVGRRHGAEEGARRAGRDVEAELRPPRAWSRSPGPGRSSAPRGARASPRACAAPRPCAGVAASASCRGSR